MPPQQHDRLLDLIDDVLDFRAHDIFHWRQEAAFESVLNDIEYEVNIKAELEVAHLHEKVDQLYEQMLDRFARFEQILARERTNSEQRTAHSE